VRIAVLCEDTAHVAVLEGLRRRWCPGAEPVVGEFRGKTGQRRRAELLQEMERLFRRKQCDCAAILLDAGTGTWHDAVKGERERMPEEYDWRTVIGAPDRNVECWLDADPKALADCTGANEAELRQARRGDPKGPVRAAFRRRSETTGAGEPELMACFVERADLRPWLGISCFAGLYEECRQRAAELGCGPLPNEREAEE